MKSKPLKELFVKLRKMKPEELLWVRKRITSIKTMAEKARRANNWLISYKDFERFKRREIRAARDEASPENFTIGKDHISKLDKDELSKFCDGLHGDDGTLSSAINSGNEIMIAANSVMAVEQDFYEEVVMPILNGKMPRIDNDDAQDMLAGHTGGW